ncbi:MAG TPA: alpha/beta hydrolase [Solirubrobacter sp.]|nr:alpha/beta hydrolase [Solirubrobacter sp.]
MTFDHILERGAGPETLLLLHATGGDEHQLLGLGRALAPAATLLSPRGQVLEGGVARRWFARHGVGRLDVPDLLARTDDLAAFIADATAEYDLGPMLAVGYSNGANIAASLLLRHPDALAGAALLRPMLPYEATPTLNGTPVLIAAGAFDPYPGADRLAALLRAGGADVTEHVAQAGHELVDADLTAAARWLAGTPAAPRRAGA